MPTIRSLPLAEIFRSRKRLRRELLETRPSNPLRVAVLGGTTTNELVDLLELLLLADGFAPVFYQSEYNRFYEDATLDVARVAEFRPDVVCIHTHVVNITRFPQPDFSETELDARVTDELGRYRAIWRSLHDHVGCQIVQNNFEHPPFAPMGNLDAAVAGGRRRFVSELNRAFARAGATDPRLLIHDVETIAAAVGHTRWFDWQRWYNYKIWTTPEGSYELAFSLAAQIGALRGRSRKCLVLDLDNTLWGGVIGDDGVDKLQIGTETAVAEAYTAFQRYCLSLRERGVVLAVCSKNDEAIARSGFSHPSSLLKVEHFSAFHANWEPKSDTIRRIASELNIGLDSLVFVDDNPAERAIVKAQLPMVAVPDVGSDVAQFPGIIHRGRYFEMTSLSKEDLARADAYAANQARSATQSAFSDYGEYLDSLQMVAEIAPFKPVYLERVTQLINKTNQFNLTTRRYTVAEVEQIAADPHFVTLYGRLTDTFGDNGLISVIIGHLDGRRVHIDLWIMSCRVLKRDMELAMLDALVDRAGAIDATELLGSYRRTAKNAMVSDHY
ncbi:MAG TPA: HAD-IIIC family phosphatase, partial [Vicinamibacterales bacterium]|nr:HAD-IIIC family phosphatase [Vicinamibacterales bacterium]